MSNEIRYFSTNDAGIKKLKYFAGGQWLDSATTKYMDCYNPSTGEVIAQAPCCTRDELKVLSPLQVQPIQVGLTPQSLKEFRSSIR
jgi:hypothetical protein